MKFKFEKLEVWQLAMDYGEAVFLLVQKFPKEERYNLSSQLSRAVDSIALNIAEGSIAQSNAEQTRFINYSIRSISEVVTCLYKAYRRNYLDSKNFNNQYNFGFNLMNRLIAFKNSITK